MIVDDRNVHAGIPQVMVALALFLLVSNHYVPAYAQTHRSHQNEYSLSLPAHWVRIPDDVLQNAFDQTYSEAGRRAGSWDAGLQPEGSPWLSWPYVVVQVIPYPNGLIPDEEQLSDVASTLTGLDVEKVVTRGKAMTHESNREEISDFKMGQATFDPQTRSYSFMTQVVGDDGVVCKALLKGYFGRRAIYQIVCYSGDADFSANRDDFGLITTSFRLTDAAAYVPPSPGRPAKRVPDWVAEAVAYAAVGLLLFGVSVVWSKLRGGSAPDAAKVDGAPDECED